MIIPPEGDILKYTIHLDFPTTNNIVEYVGVVIGLRLVKELGIR
jgi:ribonuclease HI